MLFICDILYNMKIEDYHAFCLSLPNTFEDFPFGQKTIVMKVGISKKESKIFAITDVENYEFINLKVDPEESLKLQEKYGDVITSGWHMNKKHWISVVMDDSLDEEFIERLITDSYTIVKKSLPKKVRDVLE